MLDIRVIRNDRQAIEAALRKRIDPIEVENALNQILELDKRRRNLIQIVEAARSAKKTISRQIGSSGRDGGAVEPASEPKDVTEAVQQLREIEETLHLRMSELPNIPADEVVAGGKESNKIVRTWGTRPQLADPVDHAQLATRLALVDHVRGVKLGGSGFWIYTGMGARLEWALVNYFINEHIAAGYTFMIPPHLLLESAGYSAGQFPKFYDDVYHIESNESARGQFLLPTAETAILGAYQDEILDEPQLPIKAFAYTPCYRRERAGSHSEEKGTVRGHQFNKVEIFQFVTPENAQATFDEMVARVEHLVGALGLHYQTSLLSAGDTSAAMRKTFDVEVWIPSIGRYKEVSSVSWAGDYQARRANIRYRAGHTRQTGFVHTLNGSALATSRVFPAILEQCQQPDGSVIVPEVLRPFMGGVERIGKPEGDKAKEHRP